MVRIVASGLILLMVFAVIWVRESLIHLDQDSKWRHFFEERAYRAWGVSLIIVMFLFGPLLLGLSRIVKSPSKRTPSGR
jgi:RsiW-degrading membrane proteinase PrsW (M82 family)